MIRESHACLHPRSASPTPPAAQDSFSGVGERPTPMFILGGPASVEDEEIEDEFGVTGVFTVTDDSWSGTCARSVVVVCGLRPSTHMETIVTIYKSMSTAFGVTLLQRGSQVNVMDMKTPSNRSPTSANMKVDKSTEKSVPKLALKSCTSIIGNKINLTHKTGESDELAMHGRKEYMNRAELAFVNKEAPYSPPSFGDLKDSDHESNYRGSDHENKIVPEKRPSRKDLNVGASETEEDEIRESKKQKLNKELGKGDDRCDINVKGITPLISDSEHEHENLSKSQPFPVSTYAATEASVKCVFCHSLKITEASGEMLHYLNGIPVDENHPSPDVLHVHQQCIEWAPQIYFAGDTAMNVEAELARAAKIKCSSCGLKGAALGCYVKSCRRSFHVPCAFEISGCRRDYEKFLLLCPAHASHRLTGAIITKAWKPKITHIIASTNEHGACSRTLKVLMAILAGKWVLRIDWIKACMEAGGPIEEEPYEITHDVNGSFDGPRIGRIRAMEKAPKLFAGLSFYLSGYYMPYYKGYLEDLILAAGGTVLQKDDTQLIQVSTVNETFPKPLIVYSVEPPQGCNTDDMVSHVLKKRAEDAEALAAQIGAHAVCHTWLLDSIAACNLQMH
ncbi:hypothetical protein J5N97_024453 [Dioscorea zingiberensis]|uniref:BRCA1-associated RING domain protein 1 n=1 Tax=Dioscorea zingiberensis TaxID=325984 RepID=A0A9D5C6R9_9LILI|nr:hypothetical protein J5N97_024453 [Dioscorea zingiberensis]